MELGWIFIKYEHIFEEKEVGFGKRARFNMSVGFWKSAAFGKRRSCIFGKGGWILKRARHTKSQVLYEVWAESIKRFIEDHPFLLLFGSSPQPPLTSASCLSDPSCVSPVGLLTGREEGGKGGAKSYDSEKAWYAINHSLGMERGLGWVGTEERI